MNPTASFKDAGMTVAISHAHANGARLAVCASTGNTAASMAAYCARAGMRALVLVPASGISESKVVQTLDYGAELVAVVARTSATAIKIGAPASWRKALREVRSSNGTVVAVSDEEIADARAVVGRDGVGCEPASAASLAGARRLVARGAIRASDDVVLVLTGHLLKDTAYAAAYHRSDAPFANRISAARDEADLLARIETLITAPA